MARPVPAISTTAMAVVAMLALLAITAGTTKAHEPTSGAESSTPKPARWQQTTVSVWSNWSAAICSGAYSNPTGDPTPPLSPREMRGILRAVIALLNDEIGASLTLVDAGSGPAGRHCGESNLMGGIYLGWSPLETGVAGIAPLAYDGDALVGAGVVINPILVCHDPEQWIEFVVLHEMMHALGIEHSDVPESVMYERAGCDSTAVLRADDIAALREHYPPVLGIDRMLGARAGASRARALSELSVAVTDAAVAPEQLIPRLAVMGCEVRILAITASGRSHVYVVGAPWFVNAAFPRVLDARSSFLYRCAGS